MSKPLSERMTELLDQARANNLNLSRLYAERWRNEVAELETQRADLLKALKAFTEAWDCLDHKEADAALVQAHAAIAKAEGTS